MNSAKGHCRDRDVDRRTFLRSAPARLVNDLKALWAEARGFGVRSASDDKDAAPRGIAVVDISRCLAWSAGECQACYLHCPLRGIAMVIADGKPTVVASACDGCGVCVDVCRSVNDLGAIRLVEALHT